RELASRFDGSPQPCCRTTAHHLGLTHSGFSMIRVTCSHSLSTMDHNCGFDDRLFNMTSSSKAKRDWVVAAMRTIEADFNRSGDTHLIPLQMPGYPGVDVYLKDESSHLTGSLKHRLARSLFLYALVNGWLHDRCTIIEASSGSTAVSEAYFSRLLGLPFIAVMPASTSPEKIAAIEFYGGRCHLIESANDLDAESRRLARETGGHFMDQFTYAERATDWRANNNIAESIFRQMAEERHPVPEWIICSAGTGGTCATL